MLLGKRRCFHNESREPIPGTTLTRSLLVAASIIAKNPCWFLQELVAIKVVMRICAVVISALSGLLVYYPVNAYAAV
jgi:hypothetical protein